MRLSLNTPENSRKTLARVLRARLREEIDDGTARTMIHGLGKLLEYWRFESDLRIEERLDELEAVNARRNERGVA